MKRTLTQNTPQPPAAPPPLEIPPMRTFVVTRFDPREGANAEDGSLPLQELKVVAHDVLMTQDGNVLQFVEFYLDDQQRGRQRMVKCLNGWLDYAEAAPVQSRLITPVTLAFQRPS